MSLRFTIEDLLGTASYDYVGARPRVVVAPGQTFTDDPPYSYVGIDRPSVGTPYEVAFDFVPEPGVPLPEGPYLSVVGVGLANAFGDLETTAGRFDFEAWESIEFGGMATLLVSADPDSVAATGESRVTVSGSGLDADAPVTLTVSDPELGGFVEPGPVLARGSTVETVASVTVPYSVAAAGVRFVADDEAPGSAATVTITATGGGRSGTVDVTVLPAPRLQLLRQDGAPLPDSAGYVMVSQIRPDWLLPREVDPSQIWGTPFLNDAPATGPNQYDPRTYVPAVFDVPDSLATPEALERFQFQYDVIRGGRVVYTNARRRSGRAAPGPLGQGRAAGGALLGRDSTGARYVTARQFVRLVSNGRPVPDSLAASGCEPWPPAVPPSTSPAPSVPASECVYDDEYAVGIDTTQTIPVRLNDTFRVTAYVESDDGAPADTLGRLTFPVGQPATETGIDAVRYVDLTWHGYVLASGHPLPNNPAAATLRMREDWAQAAISFRSAATATPFSAATLTTVLQLQLQGATTQGSGQIVLRVKPRLGAAREAVVDYAAGLNAEALADLIRDGLGGLRPQTFAGDSAGAAFYVSVSRELADSVRVASISNPGDVRLGRGVRPLEDTFYGSNAAAAAGWGATDGNTTTLDLFVVPGDAIRRGGAAPRRAAFAVQRPDPFVFVSDSAAVGNDDSYPLALSHEVGHILTGGDSNGPGGDATCSINPDPAHDPQSYNLLYCLTTNQGESVRSPKRLTPGQQLATRCVGGKSGDVPDPLQCPQSANLYPGLLKGPEP